MRINLRVILLQYSIEAYIAATHRKPQNEDEARRMSSPLYAANLYGEFFKDAEELQ